MIGGQIDGATPSDDGSHEYGYTPQTHSYETVTGLLVIPRAVGNPKLVRVHAEYGMRRVSWEAHRDRRPPVYPIAEDLPGDLYIGGTINVPLPRPDHVAGGYSFSASGEYLYLQNVTRASGDSRQLLNRAPGVDALPSGRYPYALPLQDQQAFQALSTVPPDPAATADNFMTLLGRSVDDGGLVSTTALYSWPFTWLPQAATDTLFA